MARSISTSPKSESAIMIVPRSVRVTGNSLRVHDVLVLDGEVQAGTGRHLPDVAAGQLLPRGLVGQLGWRVRPPALSDLFVAELDVDPVRLDIEDDAISGTEDGEVPTDRRLRRDVQYGRCVGGTALPAVAHRRDRLDAARDQRRRRLHVHHLGGAGEADRAGIADDQDAVL